jgi:epoxyqueuosine reductase QueG
LTEHIVTGGLQESLDARMKALGVTAWGVADLDFVRRTVKHPEQALAVPSDRYTRAVVMGVRLEDEVLDEIQDRPTPLYFHHYKQANYFLDRAAFEIALLIQSAGHAALAIPASQVISKDPMRGHACHRTLGWAAGLGRRGKNNLLVHPLYGARMRYVSVLTDAPLEAGKPVDSDCGDCTACAATCPAGAIHNSPEDFDLKACKAKLDEFVRMQFIGQHICGVCVKACKGKARK